jgi:DNA-binding PadR family transcriptional regulator
MDTLGYALLGLLAREPLSGYELTSRIKERVGYFWSTSYSQVYPALARLETGGLVHHRAVRQRDRPDKKVYSITTEGLGALREWVTAPVGPRPARDELVLRAYCAWVADARAAAALFREHERLHAQRLSEYEAKRVWMEREWGEELLRPDSPRFASYAALRRGMGHEREYAEWCRWVADRLEGVGDADDTGEARPGS